MKLSTDEIKALETERQEIVTLCLNHIKNTGDAFDRMGKIYGSLLVQVIEPIAAIYGYLNTTDSTKHTWEEWKSINAEKYAIAKDHYLGWINNTFKAEADEEEHLQARIDNYISKAGWDYLLADFRNNLRAQNAAESLASDIKIYDKHLANILVLDKAPINTMSIDDLQRESPLYRKTPNSNIVNTIATTYHLSNIWVYEGDKSSTVVKDSFGITIRCFPVKTTPLGAKLIEFILISYNKKEECIRFSLKEFMAFTGREEAYNDIGLRKVAAYEARQEIKNLVLSFIHRTNEKGKELIYNWFTAESDVTNNTFTFYPTKHGKDDLDMPGYMYINKNIGRIDTRKNPNSALLARRIEGWIALNHSKKNSNKIPIYWLIKNTDIDPETIEEKAKNKEKKTGIRQPIRWKQLIMDPFTRDMNALVSYEIIKKWKRENGKSGWKAFRDDYIIFESDNPQIASDAGPCQKVSTAMYKNGKK